MINTKFKQTWKLAGAFAKWQYPFSSSELWIQESSYFCVFKIVCVYMKVCTLCIFGIYTMDAVVK